MHQPRVIVLRCAGANCDLEAQHAWELAGAKAERVHIHRVIENPSLLAQTQIVMLPGGFSYGDDIAAGKILARQIQRHLGEQLAGFVERGGLLLGVCNGFQALVKAGLLPEVGAPLERLVCTISDNEPRGFQDRWVTLLATDSPCVFLEPGRKYEMPIAHGEGRVCFRREADFEAARARKLDALRYTATEWMKENPPPPANPNGSQGDIAGLCDATGRVLGLMPHPERFVTWTQHPCWTSLPRREAGDGLAIFQRALAALR